MINESSYKRSIEIWSRWIIVPIDIAAILILGADPEEDDNFENNEFSSQHDYIRALAFNHVQNAQPTFIPDNIDIFFEWKAAPRVKLIEFGEWAIGLKLVSALPEGYPKEKHTQKSTSELLENTLKTTHTSELLKIMQHCIAEVWENHDPKKPPTNELIIQWFDDNYKNNKLLTNNMKAAMSSIMRPQKYK